MSIRSIPAAWQTNLLTGKPGDQDTRVYFDPRQIDYPDIGAGAPTFTLAREDNLIDRGNCESATAPMVLGETVPVLSNATFARSNGTDDPKHGGTYSYKFTKTIAAGTLAYASQTDSIVATTDMHGLVAGETYTITVWLYIPTASGIQGTEINLYLADYSSAAAAWEGTTSAAVNTYDAWQKITVTRTLRAAATGTRIYISTASTAALNEYFYVDDIINKCHSVPGSHYLSGGYSEHLCELASSGVLQIKFHPTFAFDTASNQNLLGFYVSATQQFIIRYQATVDQFWVYWYDGGTARPLRSAQYDNGAAQRNINQWITLTLSYNLTTGTTAGSSLWMGSTQDDTAWDDVSDVKSTTFNKMQIRAHAGTAGAYDIAYVRYWPNKTITALSEIKTLKNEEVYWPLDGHALGRTRCNITSFVTSLNYSKNVANRLSGSHSANRAGMTLNNIDGEFSDDQYAAFDSANAVYNGLVTQKYLTKRCRVRIEHWYGGDFDNLFVGRVDESGFVRSTVKTTKYSTVSIGCEDQVAELARRVVKNGAYWEDKKISDATEADSLMHLITRVGSKRYVRNYAHNSGFENATIGTAWTATALTLTRDTADEFIGSACAKMVYDGVAGGTQFILQSLSFDNDEKLNVGETWTFSVALKCSAACGNDIILYEYDSGGENDGTGVAWSLAGGEGYKRFEISHTITDADSDELVMLIALDDDVTLYADMVMLLKGNRALNYYVDNTAETLDADDYVEGSYDTCGFDVDYVATVHPYKRIYEGDFVWTYVKGLADASAPRYVGFDENGTFKFRAVLATGYTDPIATLTIDDNTALAPLATNLTLRQANMIVGRGVIIQDAIQPVTQLWNAMATGLWTKTGGTFPVVSFMLETVLNGATWPPPATYGEFWADLDMGEAEERAEKYVTYTKHTIVWVPTPTMRQHAGKYASQGYYKHVWEAVPDNTGKKYRLLGSANMRMQVTYTPTTATAPTQTIFDYTTKPGKARFLLTNGAGETIYIRGVGIFGTPVMMLYGDNGRIHDKFVDWEDIEIHGEKPFEFGNEDIVTKAQLEDLADFYWKYNRTQKHVYVISYPGEAHYFQPGDWVRLDFGGAGEPEYIDSLAEIYDVTIDRASTEAGRTQIVCIEVQENWKKDSSAVARTLAGASLWNRTQQTGTIRVAASNAPGTSADVYVDGTADEVELNKIITGLGEQGGGKISLSAGTFNIAAAVSIPANVIFEGEGINATILKRSHDGYNIHVTGANSVIRNMRITRTDSSTNAAIYIDGVDNTTIENIYIGECYIGIHNAAVANKTSINNVDIINPAYRGIDSFNGGNYLHITNLRIDGEQTREAALDTGIAISGFYASLTNVTITGLYTSVADWLAGIEIVDGEGTLENIRIDDFDHNQDGQIAYGLLVSGGPAIINNASITNIDNSTTAADSRGIYIGGAPVVVTSCYVGSCTGTGIEVAAGLSRIVLTGRTYNNTTANLTDGGTNTNTAALESA